MKMKLHCAETLLLLCVVTFTTCKNIEELNKDVVRKLSNKYWRNGNLSRENFRALGSSIKELKQETSLSCNLTETGCDFLNISDQCIGYGAIFDTLSTNGRIPSDKLADTFPLLIYAAQNDDCKPLPAISTAHGRHKPTIGQAWAYGIGFCSLVVLISNIGVFLGPFMKTRMFQRILMFCVALAVGTLASTGFLVLLPESMHLTAEDSPIPNYHWKLSTVMGGAYFVFVTEKILNAMLKKRKFRKDTEVEISGISGDPLIDKPEANGHGHTHIDMYSKDDGGKKSVAPVAWILLVGDALHNFVDGLSIGAAFTENTYVGISVSLAIVCEELPHELGDIAILLHSGLSIKRALLYNFLAAVTCYIGLIIGIVVGENTHANLWIFGFAAGLFIYISLSDMIPEMSQQLHQAENAQSESTLIVFVLQNAGLLCGFGIILSLVVFGMNIQL